MPWRMLAISALPLLAGCGTLANVDGRSYALIGPPDREIRPFGGVANDLRWIREHAGRVVAPEYSATIPVSLTVIGFFGLIDLPLSLIGDFVTLPQILAMQGEPDHIDETAH